MRLNPHKTAFGRHETFPLRYSWLTKGFAAVKAEPDIFSHPKQAMIKLGVGHNMVNAIHYWLQVVGVMRFDSLNGQATPLGEALLGEEGDPYLEDDATLWLIHWLIASNAEWATGFFWFFNHYSAPRFRDQDALQALQAFVAQELGLKRSSSTLKSDLSTLLRMYAPVASRGGEDHLDSPLAALQLVGIAEGHGYNSLRALRPFLPPVALHFALQQRFLFAQSGQAMGQQAAIPVRELLYGTGWAAPGAIFRLNEEGLMAALNQVLERYPGIYEVRETAGLNQLYCMKSMALQDILSGHYQKNRL